MNVEGRIFNIDKELNELYKQRNRLMVQIRQRPQLHRVYVRYSNLMIKIREQLKLRRECQNKVSGDKLRVWLKTEHPEVYEKFFGSEKKGGNE